MASVGETVVAYLRILSANCARAERRGLEESPVSDAEVALLGALLDEGFEPECQAELGPYDADFLFRDEALCVEVDGTQHRQTVERDIRRDAYFMDQGIKTLRFSASSVSADPYACVAAICRELERRRPMSEPVEDETPTLDQVLELADDVLVDGGSSAAPDSGASLFRRVLANAADKAALSGAIDRGAFKAAVRRWYERNTLT